jgi:hypothetical protein
MTPLDFICFFAMPFGPATAAPSLRHANRNSAKFVFYFAPVCMAETRGKADVPGAFSWFFFGQAKKNKIGLPA